MLLRYVSIITEIPLRYVLGENMNIFVLITSFHSLHRFVNFILIRISEKIYFAITERPYHEP